MEGVAKESYMRRFTKPSGRNEVYGCLPKTILDCVRFWANKHPGEDAVVFRSTTEPRFAVSWQEFYERSRQMAKAYMKMGIQPGEVIAICTRPCPDWLYVVFGAIFAGITVTTIVFTYVDGSDVIVTMEKLRTCALLVLDPGLEENNWRICRKLIDDLKGDGRTTSSKLPYLRHLVFVTPPSCINDARTISNLLEEKFEIHLPPINPDDVAILFQTSGSTGIPKLAGHTQTGILTYGKTIDDNNSIFSGGVQFNDRPFGWLGGFPFGLIFGQRRVTISGMCPPTENKLSFMIDVIQSEGCDKTIILPPIINELTKRYKDLPSGWPLKTIATGGQPITKSITNCLGKVCRRLCVIYGATEMLLVSKLDVTSPEQFVDYSSGLPEHGVEVKIADERGHAVPIDERGEIYIRCGWTFHGYYNDTEKTSKVKIDDGWYKTDDYGRLNSGGYLFIEGRRSDIIISGGMNVTPVILETVLKSHPAIESAITVPVPDAVMYQVICACVIVKAGCDVTEAQLVRFMEEKHNDEEKLFTVLPKYYFILDKFPEESTGKVSRKTLRRMAEKKFSLQ